MQGVNVCANCSQLRAVVSMSKLPFDLNTFTKRIQNIINVDAWNILFIAPISDVCFKLTLEHDMSV